MDNDTIQRTASNLRRNRAYIILRYTRSSAHNTQHMGFVREHGVYMDFEDAVRELKKVRLAQFEATSVLRALSSETSIHSATGSGSLRKMAT